jgi:TusA-related sulfurtransferase/uncharacterized membrane protein YedE/YeeE
MTMATLAGGGADERTSAHARRRGGHHLLFAGAILALTGAVLIALYLAVGERTAPSAYPGLDGFPKAGVLPTKADGAVVTFIFAFIVGFLIQRSRWCNASAIRDAILFRSFRNTKPLVAAMAVITAMFTIFEVINVGQPIHIIGGMFTVLGLFLFGIGMVLGGACTVSVWVRSGEGSVAAFWALIFTFVGMFFFSEVWNVLRWPPANYLQTAHPDLAVLSFGSYDAISIRTALGSTFGPLAVAGLGALQVAVLIWMYRTFVRIERAHAAASAAPAHATSTERRLVAPLGQPVPAADRVLDCSGEMCPRPQLLTKRAVSREMKVGDVLELVVDNPSSPDLVPTIMDDIGAEHLATIRTDNDWRLFIRKSRDVAGNTQER